MKNESKFEVEYRALAPNWIRVYIKHEIFAHMKENYYKNNANGQIIKSFFKTMLMSFSKNDKTGLGGSIENEDYNIAVNIILNNFVTIEGKWLELPENQGILVVTKRNNDWTNDDDRCGVFGQ